MTLKTISPVDGSVVRETQEISQEDIPQLLLRSTNAFDEYALSSVDERIAILERFFDLLLADKEEAAKELTREMGRPVRYTPVEIATAVMRGRYMASIAKGILADDVVQDDSDFRKVIKKCPLGPVFVIFAWNYPYLILINSLVPALLAGNTLILKPSPQTPSIAERVVGLLERAGLPKNVVQVAHTGDPSTVEKFVQRAEIQLVCFTGSVAGGRAVAKAASGRFINVGLELGGKDPAYVRSDVDVDHVAEEIVDGAIFNSGQSCCSIERVYVDREIYHNFVEKVKQSVEKYTLGDPWDENIMLGPVISEKSASTIRAHIDDALKKGAESITDEKQFGNYPKYVTFVPPNVLVNVDHTMRVMTEETFGPVIPIMAVSSDEEAIRLMNDSEFGLTASVWTKNIKIGEELCDFIDAGTTFVNRADYPDSALAWTGWKESGRGHTLSKYGFEQFYKLKSLHVRCK